MKLFRETKKKLESHPISNKLINNYTYRTIISASISFLINVIFAVYNCFLGITTASAWFVTMSFSYLLLGYMRLYSVLSARNEDGMNTYEKEQKEYQLMKHIGVTLLFLTFALIGTVVLTITQKHIRAYDTIVMLTIATYTFYKITLAIINFIKVRKHNSQLLTTIRNISIADASMSVLPLQSSMIASFDNTMKDMHLMTLLTGSGICVIFLWLGVSMIMKSKRKKKGVANTYTKNKNNRKDRIK